MTEQEIRAEFKRLVIMGNHPECKTYDEALEKELGFGCRIFDYHNSKMDIVEKTTEEEERQIYFVGHPVSFIYYNARPPSLSATLKSGRQRFKIIGQPITIGRVLSALPLTNYHISAAGGITQFSRRASNCCGEFILPSHFTYWKLTTESGQETTDDDQSIETIEKLLEVLRCFKERL